MRSMAGEIPVYQEPTNGSIWGNVLEGGVDHILIMDRCVRLVYQVIMPWSILNYPYVKAAILSTYNEDPCGPCIHPTISIPSNATIPSNKTELSFPGNTTTEIPNQIAPAPVDNITVSVTTTTTPGNIAANLSNNETISTTDVKQINNTTKEMYTPLIMSSTSYLTSTETNLVNSTRNYTSNSWNKQIKSNITNSNRTKTAPTRKLKFNIYQQHRPGTAQSRYHTQISQSNRTNTNRNETAPTRKLKFNIYQQQRPGTAQSQYHTQISERNRTKINDSKISNHTTLQTTNRTISTLNKTTSLERPEINYQLEFDKAITSNRTKNHAEYSREVSTTETNPTGEQGTLLPVLSLEDGTVPIKVIIHFPHTHEQGSSILRSEYIVLQTGNPKYHGHMESTIVPKKKRRPKKPVFIDSSSSSRSSSSSGSSSSSKTSSSSSSESDEVIGLNSQNNEIVRDRSGNRKYHGKNPTGKEQRKQKWRGQHLRTTTTEIPTTPSQPFYEEKNIEEVFDDQPNYAPSYENYQPISTEEEEKHSQREHKEGENMRQEGGGKHHPKNKVMDEEGLGQSETQSENILSVKKSEVERNMLGEEQQNKGEKDQVLVKERDKVEDQKSEQIVQENQNEEDLDSTKNMIIKHYSKLLSWLDYPL